MAEPIGRVEVISEATWLHDLRYGNAHCDRKYVTVCPKFQEGLFEAGQRLRERAAAGEKHDVQPPPEGTVSAGQERRTATRWDVCPWHPDSPESHDRRRVGR